MNYEDGKWETGNGKGMTARGVCGSNGINNVSLSVAKRFESRNNLRGYGLNGGGSRVKTPNGMNSEWGIFEEGLDWKGCDGIGIKIGMDVCDRIG